MKKDKLNLKRICENNYTGTGGIIATALCCLGMPAMIGFVSAIGLGFLINDFVLFPLLALFLGLKIYSSYKNKQRHKNKYPFMITLISAFILFPSLWIPVAGYIVVGVILIAAIWDVILIKKTKFQVAEEHQK